MVMASAPRRAPSRIASRPSAVEGVALTPNAPGGSGVRPECHFIRDGADTPKRASAFLEGNAPSLPLRTIA